MPHPAVQMDWTFNGLWPYQPRSLSTPEGAAPMSTRGPGLLTRCCSSTAIRPGRFCGGMSSQCWLAQGSG